ncbi:MAG: hypothetical protein KJZ92_14960 [Rhodocyclaceae bacterium]|nr:hypothetical protein [Rhodocyclaceae bacterium]MCL4682556.1 hypothetical protein [Rhodocyclaceae bacterium]
MKEARNGIRKLLAAAGLALGLAAGGSLAADAHKHEHEHAAVPAKLELNDGKKWETDTPLRKGMENIRNSIDAVHHEIHENKLSAAKYGELAKKINGEVNGIVASCKLDPKADAQLHLVIAEILEGVEAMEGKAKKVRRQAGALKVGGALEKYAAYFHHAGWQPLRH